MCGPFSSTVTLSRGSIRLARDAAVKPAAFPPMMRIFSTTPLLQIPFARLNPGIRIAFAGSLDHAHVNRDAPLGAAVGLAVGVAVGLGVGVTLGAAVGVGVGVGDALTTV